MQERHSAQRQNFIRILPSYLRKGLLPTHFPSNLPDKILFCKEHVTSPTHAESLSLPIFYLVKLRIFVQQHTT